MMIDDYSGYIRGRVGCLHTDILSCVSDMSLAELSMVVDEIGVLNGVMEAEGYPLISREKVSGVHFNDGDAEKYGVTEEKLQGIGNMVADLVSSLRGGARLADERYQKDLEEQQRINEEALRNASDTDTDGSDDTDDIEDTDDTEDIDDIEDTEDIDDTEDTDDWDSLYRWATEEAVEDISDINGDTGGTSDSGSMGAENGDGVQRLSNNEGGTVGEQGDRIRVLDLDEEGVDGVQEDVRSSSEYEFEGEEESTADWLSDGGANLGTFSSGAGDMSSDMESSNGDADGGTDEGTDEEAFEDEWDDDWMNVADSTQEDGSDAVGNGSIGGNSGTSSSFDEGYDDWDEVVSVMDGDDGGGTEDNKNGTSLGGFTAPKNNIGERTFEDDKLLADRLVRVSEGIVATPRYVGSFLRMLRVDEDSVEE